MTLADRLLKKAVQTTALSSKDEPLLEERIQECVGAVIDALCDAAYECAEAFVQEYAEARGVSGDRRYTDDALVAIAVALEALARPDEAAANRRNTAPGKR